MPWNRIGEDEDAPSLWRDLLSGRLSTFGRIALSVASFGAALTASLIVIGILSEGGRVAEEIVALVLVVGGLAWLLALAYLWFGHAVLGPVLRALFGFATIWFVAILLAVIANSQLRHEEIWVFACIVGGLTASALLAASIVYQRMRGRSIVARTGQVNVQCADCGYSLVGKTDCTCPECGRKYTVDELIALQDYDALRGAKVATLRENAAGALAPGAQDPTPGGAAGSV